MKDDKITIGKIVNAVGLKGEVKVYPYTEPKERFEDLDEILLQKKNASRTAVIEGVRYQKNMVILKLAGVDDRNGAEALRDQEICITEADLKELPEDTYYVRDLIGCQVFSVDEDGLRCFGHVTDVLQNTAQDVYQIRLLTGKDAWIPAVGDFIQQVDIKEKKILVRLIPGLIDDRGLDDREDL